MIKRRLAWVSVIVSGCALLSSARVEATGVPIGGFLPMVGFGLTDEFDDDFNTSVVPSPAPGGMLLGNGGAFYDIALLDTGAAVSLLTAQAHADFNMNGPYPGEPEGFQGTEQIQIGGATGSLVFADINDPVGLYVGGLQGRAGTAPFVMNHSALEGQTNTSLVSLPSESDLPNIIGLTFASQYATSIRSDLPQIFSMNGKTVRTPYVDFLPLGSGPSQGITRRASMSLNPGSSFQQPPFWFYNLEDFDIDNPHEDPSIPTVIQGALFLNVDVTNDDNNLNNFQFFFDTGADVTVVSELNAGRLGFDLDGEPDFTVAVIGSGGVLEDVPGFFADTFTIQVNAGGNVTLTNVPIIVLDVPNPADPGNVVDGIVGTNLLAGRNLVIDPIPALGGGGAPRLYISDPVTTQRNWTAATPSGTWSTPANWSGATVPDTLSIANVRHVAGGNQTAMLTASTTVWELNVSGGGAGQTMTVAVQSGVTLTTFSGINIEQGGVVELQNGSLDTQYVEILGGTLRGSGTIATGSGPIPGQVENRGGLVAPGNGVGTLSIVGRFANSVDGTVIFEVGGTTAGTQYDQLVIDGAAALKGTFAVTLADLGGGLFNPSIGNSFTLLTATEGIGGTFDQLLLPSQFQWNVTYGANSLIASVVGLALAGDFNQSGVVDATDYVLWRNGFGTIYTQADYNLWRANFGKSLGSGSNVTVSTAVPEPVTGMLFVVAALSVGIVARRRRYAR